MKIYKIYRIDGGDYDEYDSFVIIAANTHRVRMLAMNEGMSWCKDSWLSPKNSRIQYIGKTHRKKEKVLLGSYNAG